MAVVIVMAIIIVVVALCFCIHTVVHLNSGAVAVVVFYVKIDHVPRENFILRTDSRFLLCHVAANAPSYISFFSQTRS